MNRVMIVGTRGNYRLRVIIPSRYPVPTDIPLTASMAISLIEDTASALRSILAEEREKHAKESTDDSQAGGPGADQGV